MKGILSSLTVCCLVLGLAVSPAFCESIDVQVSPGTVNLASSGTCVTVHAEIPFATVDGPVALTIGEGELSSTLPSTSTFPDDCGDLVAKFDIALVKESLAKFLGEEKQVVVTAELSGTTTAGTTFTGSDDVQVVNVGGKRR